VTSHERDREREEKVGQEGEFVGSGGEMRKSQLVAMHA